MKLSEAILDDVYVYIFYKDLFTLHIWMFCLHGSVCTMHIPCSYRAQKSASDFLELELQIMRHHVGAENWARAANTLNLRAISCLQLDCIYFLIMIKTPNLKFSFLIINIFLKKIYCLCVYTHASACTHMPCHARWRSGATSGNLSAMWILEIELRLSGLAFTCWTVSLVLFIDF